MAIGLIIVLVLFVLGTVLGPQNPTPEKMLPYESGSDSDGANHIRPSVKFYLTAILFVAFDIEAVFLYPWSTRFRALGWMGFVEMLSFLFILTLTLVYAWKKGALKWEN